jgi:peptide/nickel transport system permease protein
MQNYFKRLMSIPVVVLGVILINFTLFYMSPGDPTSAYFSPNIKMETLDMLREKMGVHASWGHQLYQWTKNVLHGDFGYSWSLHRPVGDVLKEAIPATLLLTFSALAINMLLGCSFGVWSAVLGDRPSGKLINVMALFVYAMPPFWLALFMIYLFSTKLNLLPPSGMSSMFFAQTGWFQSLLDRLAHLILPATVLGLVGAAATFRFVRANIAHALQEDYITLAHAKGLSSRRVFFRHALANSLLPVVTLLGLYLPLLLGGTFIIEVIFAWPGIGRITYGAVFAKDLPLLMAINLVVALLVIFGNVLADIVYRLVDPRVRIN